jgi:hypothetical protein
MTGIMYEVGNDSGGDPGGTDGQVQFNNNGVLGGFGGWDGTALSLPVDAAFRYQSADPYEWLIGVDVGGVVHSRLTGAALVIATPLGGADDPGAAFGVVGLEACIQWNESNYLFLGGPQVNIGGVDWAMDATGHGNHFLKLDPTGSFLEYTPLNVALRDSADEVSLNPDTREAYSTDGTTVLFGWTGGIGFFGTTPATQYPNIGDPAGGATEDAEARATISAILILLASYGLMATV